jgi:hypothetical protein
LPNVDGPKSLIIFLLIFRFLLFLFICERALWLG